MRPIMRQPRRYLAALALAAVTVIVVAVGVVRARSGAAVQADEPWPAFTMTWRETANNLGLNGTPGT